jgi:hypothetical protein
VSYTYYTRALDRAHRCLELEAGLKDERATLKNNEAHVQALKKGDRYKPQSKSNTAKVGSKRKRSGSDGKSFKQQKTDESSDEEVDSDDDADYQDEGDVEDITMVDESDADDQSDGHSERANSSDAANSDEESDEDESEPEELTIDDLQDRIAESKEAIKFAREQLTEERQKRKEVSDAITKAKRDEAMAQKDKNAFCSLKRSAYSQGVLKEDFRTGLKDLDDAAVEERDPDNFDPTVDVRGKINPKLRQCDKEH